MLPYKACQVVQKLSCKVLSQRTALALYSILFYLAMAFCRAHIETLAYLSLCHFFSREFRMHENEHSVDPCTLPSWPPAFAVLASRTPTFRFCHTMCAVRHSVVLKLRSTNLVTKIPSHHSRNDALGIWTGSGSVTDNVSSCGRCRATDIDYFAFSRQPNLPRNSFDVRGYIQFFSRLEVHDSVQYTIVAMVDFNPTSMVIRMFFLVDQIW